MEGCHTVVIYHLPHFQFFRILTGQDTVERLLLNQIPLEPVVQFYLDAPDSFRIEAHAEFLYGEDKITPFSPAPAGLLRDVRAESRAKRLLASYLQPGVGGNEEDNGMKLGKFYQFAFIHVFIVVYLFG